jgi:hypothetical protein
MMGWRSELFVTFYVDIDRIGGDLDLIPPTLLHDINNLYLKDERRCSASTVLDAPPRL